MQALQVMCSMSVMLGMLTVASAFYGAMAQRREGESEMVFYVTQEYFCAQKGERHRAE